MPYKSKSDEKKAKQIYYNTLGVVQLRRITVWCFDDEIEKMQMESKKRLEIAKKLLIK